MKLFIKFFEELPFKLGLEKYKNLEFSLFMDCIPKSVDDLSPINILVLEEPNEYFGHHTWAIQNKHLFSFILTWSDEILKNCENAILFPIGTPWITDEIANKPRNKIFSIAHLSGKLNLTFGHSLRHEVFNRQDEIEIPKNFYKTIGDRYDIPNAIIGKETVFGESMFGVVIENTHHNNYFTEKISDCMSLKTVPIYWGCPNISNYYNSKGIIPFDNVNDLIKTCNNLTPKHYHDIIDVINENYQKAFLYKNYENRVCNVIDEIFTHNNLLNN